MMKLQETIMPDLENNNALKTTLILAVCGIGLLFCIGIIVGMFAEHIKDGGGPMSNIFLTIIAAAIAVMIAISVYLYRPVKGLFSRKNELTKRERLNHKIMWFSGLIGALTAVTMLSLDPLGMKDFSFLSNSNIPVAAAIGLAVMWCIGMPILAYVWHKKAIDEQEAAAYRDGAYFAAYAYVIGAPTWWILARGGLVPPINGVVIFIIFNFIWLGVWFYKKYR
jgi:NhaP-type Na+/H+ or K+/H+ antiporter